MRRKDREVTSKEEIVDIISRCDVFRIAMTDNTEPYGYPYIVPMNYGFEYREGILVFYFHSANRGKKLDIMRKNPNVCFELDCSHKLIESEIACGYGMEFESVIGYGRIHFITDKDEKVRALSLLMKKYVPDKSFTFSETSLNAVTTFKLIVSEVTGKRLIK